MYADPKKLFSYLKLNVTALCNKISKHTFQMENLTIEHDNMQCVIQNIGKTPMERSFILTH